MIPATTDRSLGAGEAEGRRTWADVVPVQADTSRCWDKALIDGSRSRVRIRQLGSMHTRAIAQPCDEGDSPLPTRETIVSATRAVRRRVFDKGCHRGLKVYWE